MCEHFGTSAPTFGQRMDFGRRGFLHATAATSIALAMGPGLLGVAHGAETGVVQKLPFLGYTDAPKLPVRRNWISTGKRMCRRLEPPRGQARCG